MAKRPAPQSRSSAPKARTKATGALGRYAFPFYTSVPVARRCLCEDSPGPASPTSATRVLRRIAGKQVQIPYIVAGCGGHADQPVQATGATVGDHKFEKAAQGYGYPDVVANAKQLSIEFHLVLGPHGLAPAGGARVFDSVKVDLATQRLA